MYVVMAFYVGYPFHGSQLCHDEGLHNSVKQCTMQGH